jgi:predicted nucleic acid-binding protein
LLHTRELVLEAVELRQRYQISYWDAAIIAAAKQIECTVVYSEDLNPGQDYDGVTVINPFAVSAVP